MVWTFKILIGLVISILVIAGVLALHPVVLSIGSSNLGPFLGDCIRNSDQTLIILDSNGMNGSRSLGPVTLHMLKGETMNLLLCNEDNVQAHGFGIDHYFDTGVTLRPGQIYRLSITLKDSGTFTIYCNVFCTVHVFMIGKLVVV